MARPTTLPKDWAKLAEAMGGVTALATRCGVSYQTIERWAKGDFMPGQLTQDAVGALAASVNVDAPRFHKKPKAKPKARRVR